MKQGEVNIMNEQHEVYTKLKSFLGNKGVTQTELAKWLGISRTTVNLKLNRRGTDFTGDDIRLICKKFNISADEFFLFH